MVCVTNTGNRPVVLYRRWESRPPEAGLQEQASNHPVLLRSKDVVVSDREKSPDEGGR
jgi:IS5 family transposase